MAPKELVTIVGKIFDYEIPSGEKVEVAFDCPNLTGLPNGTSGKPWVTLHLKVPRFAYIDQYALTSFAKIDVREWDLSGVQDIGLCAFAWPNYPTDTLRFPLRRRSFAQGESSPRPLPVRGLASVGSPIRGG